MLRETGTSEFDPKKMENPTISALEVSASVPAKPRLRFFRDARNVSFSLVVGMGLLALRSVLVLDIVGPRVIGIWKSVMAVLFASGFLRLGVPQGIGLRMPYLRGQGRGEEAERLARSAGTFVALWGGALGSVVFACSFFATNADYRLALRFIAGVTWLNYVQEFLREVAGARHLFGVRVVETQVDAVTNFIATLALAWWFSLAGLGSAALLTCLLPIGYLGWKLGFRVAARIDFRGIASLVRTGLPYSFMEYASHVTRYLGIPVVAFVIGPVAAGYFALSVLILEFASNIIHMGVSRVVGPHLMHDFGRVEDYLAVARYYELPTKLFSYVSPPALALTSLTLPALVPVILPKFGGGIAAAQVAVWAVFFLGAGASVDAFVSAARKVTSVLKALLVIAPAAISAHYLAALHLGLEGVAWSCVATIAAVTTAKLYVARRECGYSPLQTVGFLGMLYLPAAFSMALSIGLHRSGATSAAQAGAYLLLYAPLFIFYERRLSLLRLARQAM
ncbi:MAG: oligosaccharide flippase family protein [Bryobacteraceae bacterium]|nr:oligosaccharide flippase family protein [Bryobacteraceae bacterium]